MSKSFMPWVLAALCAFGLTFVAGCSMSASSTASTLVSHTSHHPLTPMTKGALLYPREALLKGIHGFVLVCFTVGSDGAVINPYIKSASSATAKRYLGKAALETMSTWKYYPWLVDGKPVAASDVCHPVSFSDARVHKGRTPLTPMAKGTLVYPRDALLKGIHGSIRVCFTVEEDGAVYKPYIKSASSATAKKYLGKAALKNISITEFYPWLVNGKPVTITGVCSRVRFLEFDPG